MLPIVQRELQVTARSRRLYTRRLWAGAILAVVSLAMILFSRGGLRAGGAGGFFQTACYVALFLCLVEGLQKTSDAISEEKREGTLGLLFLTDLNGFDVVLGKLAAAAIRSFNTLLAFLPLLAISLLLGGTTGGEFWRAALVLTTALWASLSLCLLASVLSRDRSMSAAGIILFLCCVLPYVISAPISPPLDDWIAAASPFYLLRLSSEAFYSRSSNAFWIGVLSLGALSFAAIIVGSSILPRVWQDRAQVATRRRSPKGRMREAKHRSRLLDENPTLWLMSDSAGTRWLHIFAYALGLISLAVVLALRLASAHWGVQADEEIQFLILGFASAAGFLAIYLYAAREATRNIAEARHNGLLDLILSTPVREKDLIRGQFLAIRRALLPPVIIIGAVVGYLLLLSITSERASGLIFAFKSIAEAVLGLFTVIWFGMWMALTSKGPARAYFKTLLFAMVLPFIVCTPTLLNQAVLLAIAAERVNIHFRRYLANRYSSPQEYLLAPVPRNLPGVPPVLR